MKVLGFYIDAFYRSELDKMTDKELYQLCLDTHDTTIVVYDNIKKFFTDLNDEYVDTENYWYYFVNIS